MDKLILEMKDAQATIEKVGGKASSLTKLVNAGIPVPDGFYITTAAYQQFVNDNDLQSQIMHHLEGADIGNPQSLEKASTAIHSLFVEAPIPQSIAQAITGAYGAMQGTLPVVAVRSSATAEDLPELSFAGQQDTYLNIKGITEVVAAVRECWASLWTARAIGYRIRNDIDQKAVSLAVVVQELVPADAAGILFTANPVNNKRDQIMITASWGLGEAVVSGTVTPDTIIVQKETGDISSYKVSAKDIMTVRVNGGTENQSVPPELRTARVLDASAISRLTDLGKSIEKLYEQPMDIEWALADGDISIVQARPITQLGEPTYPPPTEWELPDTKGHYMRASIIDLMPDPLTPLFETLGLSSLNSKLKLLVGMMANSKYELSHYCAVTINGYAYLDAGLNLRDLLFMVFRLVPAIIPLLRDGPAYWRDIARVKYKGVTERWQLKELTTLSSSELLKGVRETSDAAMEHLTSVMVFLGQCAGSEGLTTNLYNKMVKREGDPIAAALIMGYDSEPVRGEKALYDLAQWCGTQPTLADFMSNTDSEIIGAYLLDGSIPDGLDPAIWQAWKQRFQDYLKEYGHSIYDLDFGEALPSDNPALFIENCKLYISGEGQNPYERQKAYAERREALIKESFSRLKCLKAKIFRIALNWAQSMAPLREDGIANMGYGYPVLRKMAKEIGRRLVEEKALDEKEDIFWLVEEEVEACVNLLDNHLPIDTFNESVKERKAIWRARRSITPPPQLPAKAKYLGIKTDVFLAHGTQEGDTIKGVAGSPGMVTGPARILNGPEDFDKLQKGDILVASITTPAWTPLFVMASAVVTDIGGPLSHGSIVAREYGIPAVLGTGVATRSITDGQTITVNGSTGEVILQTQQHSCER